MTPLEQRQMEQIHGGDEARGQPVETPAPVARDPRCEHDGKLALRGRAWVHFGIAVAKP